MRRHQVLALDYDGTVAENGHVPDAVRAALVRARAAGVKLVLLTGRELEDLMRVCPVDLFDAVVAENGALLYRVTSAGVPLEHPLASPPPPEFARALRTRGVTPLALGRIILATLQGNEQTVLAVIREQGLELEIVFDKGSVLVLPSGVNKGTGLAAALASIGVAPNAVVGVGDAENDHSLLASCDVGVAVANAVPALKARADLVLDHARGAGVVELCERLLAGELDELPARDAASGGELRRERVAVAAFP